MTKRVLLAIVSTLALVHAVLLYGLIGENEILWLAGAALVLFVVLKPRKGLALSFTVLGCTLLLAGLIKLSGLDESVFANKAASSVAYSLLRGHQIFEPNLDMDFKAQGDLGRMTKQKLTPEPREVRFKTDSLGYRNDVDYNDEPYLLVGDSFIAASTTTQQDILSAQLRVRYGLGAYNIAAVGGDLADYVHWIRHARKNISADAKILLFFFEGNDFEKVRDRDAELPAYKLWLKRYRNMMRFTSIGKFMYATVKGLTNSPEGEQVLVEQADGTPLAFFNKYVEVAKRESYPNPEDFRAMLASVASDVHAVFFIPAKWRVYGPLVSEQKMPNAQWEYLQKTATALELPCFNLTEPLRLAAADALPHKGFLWYTDDTHWNAHGIGVAANAVARALKELNGQDNSAE